MDFDKETSMSFLERLEAVAGPPRARGTDEKTQRIVEWIKKHPIREAIERGFSYSQIKRIFDLESSITAGLSTFKYALKKVIPDNAKTMRSVKKITYEVIYNLGNVQYKKRYRVDSADKAQLLLEKEIELQREMYGTKDELRVLDVREIKDEDISPL